MQRLIPQSEDFFYWAPEEICHYPVPPGPEDDWFTTGAPPEHQAVDGNTEQDRE